VGQAAGAVEEGVVRDKRPAEGAASGKRQMVEPMFSRLAHKLKRTHFFDFFAFFGFMALTPLS
jgi:hypothetical protein